MKSFLIVFLSFFSFATYARTLNFCAKINHSQPDYTLEVVNDEFKPLAKGLSSRIICENSLTDSYFWINSIKLKGGFKIHKNETCLKIIEAMESNPRTVYEFVVENSSVVKVSKSVTKKCDHNGKIKAFKTVLDL